MKRQFLPLLLSLLCFGCNTANEDASDLLLFISPSSLSVNEGEQIYFDIQSWTRHEYIARIEIESFDRIEGTRSLFTDEPREREYTERFFYRAPEIPVDTLPIEITFRVTDNRAETRNRTFDLAIFAHTETAPLAEKAGVILYSPYSGKPDGFSLATEQTLRSATSLPEEVDIYLYTDPENISETLSREWRTMTDVRFAKANEFDYAGATRNTINTVYAGLNRKNYVCDLSENDIILVGRLDKAWGVIRIESIHDESGTENDRYRFNFKKI